LGAKTLTTLSHGFLATNHLPSTLTAHPSPFPITQCPYNPFPAKITQPEDPSMAENARKQMEG
ncbi:hypothetical protein Tco_0380204, partial [Tanacetum coccineum]